MPSYIKKRIAKDGRTASYIVTLPVANPEPGGKKTKSKTFDKKKKANKYLRDWHDQGKGEAPRTDHTLSSWLEEWLEEAELRGNTRYAYGRSIACYVPEDLGKLPLGELTRTQVKSIYTKMKKQNLAPSTVRTLHVILQGALKEAIADGFIRENPCTGIKLPKREHKESTAMTKKQLHKLLAASVGTRYEAIFHLLAATGIRPSEACGLQWEHLDHKTKEINVKQSLTTVKGGWQISPPKTAKARRKVTLTDAAYKNLMLWKSAQAKLRAKYRTKAKLRALTSLTEDMTPWNGNFMFTKDDGTPFTSSKLTYGFQQLRDKIGVPKEITLYSLRHTFATLLLRQKIRIKVVSEMLGHSDILITLQRYSHILGDDLEEAKTAIDVLVPPVLPEE